MGRITYLITAGGTPASLASTVYTTYDTNGNRTSSDETQGTPAVTTSSAANAAAQAATAAGQWVSGWMFKRPNGPGWWGDPPDEGRSDGERWPKDDKNFCIRTYANCQNFGWTGNCQACLDRCKGSGDGNWPFEMCSPPNKKGGNFCAF